MTRARRCVLAVIAGAAMFGLPACAGTTSAALPSCTSVARLALVAQSVPSAAYVPCLAPLPRGWSAGVATVASGHTRFSISSDQAPDRPVVVDFRAACQTGASTVGPSRAPGVTTSILLRTIMPRYQGTLYDVFAGGCVSYHFNFDRGPHIPLMEDLESTVQLYSRQTLAEAVHRELGVNLDPSR